MTPHVPAPLPQKITLIGQYLRLEPVNSEHATDLWQMSQHIDAAALYRFLPSDTPPQAIRDVQIWIQEKQSHSDPLFFACVSQQTGRAVGRQSLMRITPDHGVIEIGNILWGPEMARSRLATEAFFLFASYVFDRLKYRRFEWKCDALNQPSRTAALRFGFSFEGIFRQHMWVKDANRDTAWFSLVDHEWLLLKPRYQRWLSADNFDQQGQQKRSLANV